MASGTNLLKSVSSLLHRYAVSRAQQVQPKANNAIPKIEDEDTEEFFLRSIAHLTPEEQQMRLQRRAFYQRLAERQGIMEAERYADDMFRSRY
jgi:hypothetical protein